MNTLSPSAQRGADSPANKWLNAPPLILQMRVSMTSASGSWLSDITEEQIAAAPTYSPKESRLILSRREENERREIQQT